MRRLFRAVLPVAALVLSSAAAARDLAAMTGDEIVRLQQRLVEAGCYAGPADGQVSSALSKAKAACPDQEPVLRIEAGMHTGPLKRAGVDAACTTLVTSSYDKTVRLWSLPDGALKKVFRLPISPGHGGKVYAAALSPDGRAVAAAGYDAQVGGVLRHALYLIDVETGVMRRHGAAESSINHVAWSPDGRRVALALNNGFGVRILDAGDGRELMAARGFGGATYGVAFAPDGALLTASWDGMIRRYGPDMKPAGSQRVAGGNQPTGLAIDPTGTRLAVSFNDTAAVPILDARTLRPIGRAATGDLKNIYLGFVAWNADGTQLAAGGGAFVSGDPQLHRIVRRFAPDGRAIGGDVPVSLNAVSDLLPCKDGFVFAAQDPVFGLIDGKGAVTTVRDSANADMRGKREPDAFRVSADGTVVRFGLREYGADPVRLDIATGTLADAPRIEPGLAPPKVDGLPLRDWINHFAPKLGNTAVPLDQNEASRALTVLPDRSGFIIGGDWNLHAYDNRARPRWKREVPAAAWGVNTAQGGKLVIAALGDGTLRWYRGTDGAELLAVFVDAVTRRWIAWTPAGYYMASPGGEDLIGWHLNRGWDQPPDFFPASRFRDRFNRPDVVRRVLVTLDEDTAVDDADTAAGRRKSEAPQSLAARLPPVATLLPPPGGRRFTAPEVTLNYILRSPSGLPVDAVEVLVDGRPLGAGRGLGRAPGEGATVDAACPAEAPRGLERASAGRSCRIVVTLPARDVEVALVPRSGTLLGEPARLRLDYAGPETKADKPRLFVLAVGVADYADAGMKLDFAAKDARDFAAALVAQKDGLYGDVIVRSLIDRDATHDSVLDGLQWLEGAVGPGDVGVVFLAGHGVTLDGRFWYMPSDADASKVRTRGVSKDDIRAALGRLAGRAVLFLDTCHAAEAAGKGAVDLNGVVNELAGNEAGVVVFGSSMGRELSLESAEWSNGAFTKAVVEGIAEGKADLLATGEISLSELDAYVAGRVKTLTAGRQHPVMVRPATVPNFPLALARR